MATRRPQPPPSDEREVMTKHPKSGLAYADYSIAWICALPLELAASRAMLDEEHESLAAHDGDHNTYVLGRIGKHNVVMVALPGIYGKVNAANVSAHLKRSFPNIKATLMVGIGGGAPGEADLYLGDVVVGTRVMEYDLGKATHGGQFELTAIAKLPSSRLLSAVVNLKSKHGLDQWSARSQELLRTKLPRHVRPTQPDRLFQASYVHPRNAPTCDNCDAHKLQPRVQRLTTYFWVHYGVIASGDSVNKDACKRDALSRRLKALCFEMEAAGIMDSLECLPIRGICDYSDSHKNKAWQDYAAATAASYARELLETIPSMAGFPIVRDTATVSMPPTLIVGRVERQQSLIDLLGFPQINARKDAIRAEQGRTCRWFLTHEKYRDWANLSSRDRCGSVLWIRGKAGAGKSTLMKFLYSNAKCELAGVNIVSFFFNARGDYLEKSISGMYRSLLKQILTQLPDLRSILDQIEFPSNGEPDFSNLNTLKDLFRNAIMALGRRSLVCFIDALDECNEDDVRDMVQCFEDLTESATEENIQFRVCFSSRPYPYIQVDEKVFLTLENERGHANDLATYVRKRLKAPKKLQGELQCQILEKACGVFMWVVLVVEILNKETAHGGLALRKKLAGIPPSLSEIFRNILTRDEERPEQLRRCIFWILYAYRPLTPGEFCHAMWAAGLAEDQVDDEMPDAEDDEANVALVTSSSKGLAEVTNVSKKDSTVQFIHESVRDFLIKEKGLQELWPELGFEWEGPTHESLRSCCESYLMHPTVRAVMKTPQTPAVGPNHNRDHVANDPPVGEDTSDNRETPIPAEDTTKACVFLEYASQRILYHANHAARSVPQKAFLGRFFSLLGTEALDSYQRVKVQRYGPTACPLYVLADQGLSSLLRIQLEVQGISLVRHNPAVRFQHPIFAAIASGHKDTVAAILGQLSATYNGEDLREGLDRRSDIKCKGRTLMSWAAQEGKIQLADVLYALNKETLIQKDSGRHTPLERAAQSGQGVMVTYLLNKGVSVNTGAGCRAIYSALVEGHRTTTNILLETFSAYNMMTLALAGRCLRQAVGHGYEEIVQRLFQAGIRLDAISSRVLPPITIAAENGHLYTVKALYGRGVRVPAGAIRAAASNGHLSVVEFLSNKTANHNADVMTVAATNGHLNIMRFLAGKGVSINSTTWLGRTPLASAAAGGQEAVVQFLISAGADLNVKTRAGETAYDLALQNNQAFIAGLLQDALRKEQQT